MLGPLVRKGRQLFEDPVLCRWLVRRAFRLEPRPPAFVAGRPPYLTGSWPETSGAAWRGSAGAFEAPSAPARIALAGATVAVDPRNPGALFRGPFADLETELSAHRFAWVPVAGRDADTAWVAALWEAWLNRYGDAADGWAWHTYTAAERAINLIDFARHHGLPGDADRTVTILARHADAIARNLEYFGDHYTSNHLANDGRGLLRVGTALGLDGVAALGADIMVAEAARIFGRSGLLREGSTHYHLLLSRNYADAWLEADAAGMPQAAALRETVVRALCAASRLRLGGGMPLIGDISPDCPPDFLASLAEAAASGGWIGCLDQTQTDAFASLRETAAHAPEPDMASDGWHRFGAHGWEALAYVPADGWAPMPGHGHQDLSGFELHFGRIPVIVDPGRGSYRDTPADRLYESAAAHNGLSIDGADPAPRNRPYYADAFRRRIVATPPAVSHGNAETTLVHSGYARLRGVGAVRRTWRFEDGRVRLFDSVDGRGRHRIRRQFATPHPVKCDGRTATVEAPGARFRIDFSAPATLRPITLWSAYGAGNPGSLIVSEGDMDLPCELSAVIERGA